MTHATGFGVDAEVRLVGEDAVAAILELGVVAADQRDVSVPAAALRLRRGCTWWRHHGITSIAAPAREVAQLHVLADFVVDDHRGLVAVHVLVIALLQAIEVAPVEVADVETVRHAGRQRHRQAVVGQVVEFEMRQVDLQLGWRADTQRQRWGDTQRTVVGGITSRHAAVLPHGIQAQCRVIADLAVVVETGAIAVGTAGTQLQAGEVVVAGLLGHQVDGTTGTAAAADCRGRTLGDLHGFKIEGIAAQHARIAHAVDIDIVTRREAAQEHVVTRRAAAFTGLQGDARRVAQHVAQRGLRLLLGDLDGDDGQALRRVAHRLAVLGRGRALLGLAGDGHRFQLLRLVRAGILQRPGGR